MRSATLPQPVEDAPALDTVLCHVVCSTCWPDGHGPSLCGLPWDGSDWCEPDCGWPVCAACDDLVWPPCPGCGE